MRRLLILILLLVAMVWTGGLVRALSLSRWCELTIDQFAGAVQAFVPKSTESELKAMAYFRYAYYLDHAYPRQAPLHPFEGFPKQPSFGETAQNLLAEGGRFGARGMHTAERFLPFGLSGPTVHLGESLLFFVVLHIAMCFVLCRMLRTRLRNGLDRTGELPSFLRTMEFALWSSPVWVLAVGALRPSIDVWYSIVQATGGKAQIDLGIAEHSGPLTILVVYVIALAVGGVWFSNRWFRRQPSLGWRSVSQTAGSFTRYVCWSCRYPVSDNSVPMTHASPMLLLPQLATATTGTAASSVCEPNCSECGQINPSVYPQWSFPSLWILPSIKPRNIVLLEGLTVTILFTLPITVAVLRDLPMSFGK